MIDNTAILSIREDRLFQCKRITMKIGDTKRYLVIPNERTNYPWQDANNRIFINFYTSEEEANAPKIFDAEYTEREIKDE